MPRRLGYCPFLVEVGARRPVVCYLILRYIPMDEREARGIPADVAADAAVWGCIRGHNVMALKATPIELPKKRTGVGITPEELAACEGHVPAPWVVQFDANALYVELDGDREQAEATAHAVALTVRLLAEVKRLREVLWNHAEYEHTMGGLLPCDDGVPFEQCESPHCVEARAAWGDQ